MSKLAFRVIPALLLTSPLVGHSEEFGGIEFPGGISSFADQVTNYDPLANGGPAPTADTTDPSAALSAPDDVYVTLGRGGELTLRFVDNVLTASGDDEPDLHIFETGPDVEDTFVEISRDGVTYSNVGKVTGGTSSIDIDAFGFAPGDRFSYVRLTDDPNEGNSSGEYVGADIDAVGAISSVEQTACGGFWYDPSQFGTAVSIFQNGDRVVGTMNLYDQTGGDMWLFFSGQVVERVLTVDLLRVSGPVLGSAYDPALLVPTVVGTARFDFINATNIDLAYTIDGIEGSMALRPFRP